MSCSLKRPSMLAVGLPPLRPRTSPGAPVIPSQTYTYDYLDRVTRIENADGSYSEREYASGVSLAPARDHWLAGLACASPSEHDCAVDVVLSTGTHDVNEPGKQSVTILDYAGVIVRTIDGEHVTDGSASSNYEYGPFNRLRKMFDNAGTATGFTYDPYGQLLQHADPDAGSTTYTYNGFGDIKTSSRNGLRTFHHDRLGRLTSIAEHDGTSSTWTYDQGVSALGQLSETTSPATLEAPNGQRVKYSYEPMTQQQRRGLLSSVQYTLDDTPYVVGLRYDEQARLEYIDYPTTGEGTPIVARYHYQPQSGALEKVTEIGSGAPRPIWELDEAFQGQLAHKVTYGNGAKSTFGYDSARRWLDFAWTSLDDEGDEDLVFQDLVYDHYSDGQLQDRREPNRSQEYFYDQLGRLDNLTLRATGVSPTQQNFNYDAHGNLTQNDAITSAFDTLATPHLPTMVGGNSYEHYPNGNLRSRTGTNVPGGTQLFTYTPFDLPRSITHGAPQRTTRFDYTADEQRVVRRDPDATRYQVGGLYERLVSSSAGATLEQRFRISAGGSVVAEVVRSGGADRTLFFHPDHLGTPETISDNAGDFTKQDYAPFGARQGTPPTIAGVGTRVGFTSQHQDDDLGLVDMHGRIYDPLAGRFTTADPIMQAPFFSQGQNRYAYVLNDPINLTDPSGMAFESSGDPFSQGHIVGDLMAVGAVGIAGSILTYGIVSEIGVSAASGGLSFGLGGLNLAKDLMSLVAPGAPSGGGSYNAAAPSAAPQGRLTKSTATNALTNARGGAPVQERPGPTSANQGGQRLDAAQAGIRGVVMPPEEHRGYLRSFSRSIS